MEEQKKHTPIQWQTLKNHIDKWFYQADTEALEVVLSAVAAHPAIKGDPIWLFVQGPSGSGKGEIIVNSLRKMPPYTRVLGAVNKNSMISFNRGIPGGELLNMAKDGSGEFTGIFVFKDFTTMLSLREEERNEIIAQFREIYDGSWTRSTGSGAMPWVGKATVIAACTPALESAWAMKRDLGERFLTVKWARTGSKELAKAAGRQRGHETLIRTTTAELAQIFVSSTPIRSLPDLPEPIFEKISNLAEMVAVLRASVPRASGSKREILGEPVPEEPGRIHKSLSALSSAHAALFRHDEVEEDDFRIAKRVALDSIPSNRFAAFRHLPNNGEWITASTWAKTAKSSASTIVWQGDEMVALGVLEVNEEKDIKEYRLSDKFQDLLRGAGLQLPL